MPARRHTDIQLNDAQLAALGALRDCGEGVAPVGYLRSSGLSTRDIRRALEDLEQRGLVRRYYNAHGPQTPWWWLLTSAAPAGFSAPELSKGQIWDWDDRVWLEVKGGHNEFGLPRVMVKAGEHNQVDTVLPAHYFHTVLRERVRGPVTAYSASFSCAIHGECTEDMVTTKKTCRICGLMLRRH
jgi:hypothetical protein